MLQIPLDLVNESIDFIGNVKTEVQLEAMHVLFEIGGQEALNSLSTLLLSCIESVIVLEAVKSSSQITAGDYSSFNKAL